jgi:predicted secreted protein
MNKPLRTLAFTLPFAIFAALPAQAATSQPSPTTDAAPTLRLDASASQELVDDTAWASLVVEREAKDAAEAQRRVTNDMNQVVSAAKRVGNLELRSGSTYSVPVYGKDSQITAWRTYAELRVESKTTAAVTRLSADVASLARLGGTGFFLSPESRNAVEKGLIATAVREFQDKAKATALALGFQKVSLQEVSLGQSGGVMVPMRAMMMKESRGGDAAGTPLSLEPGKSTVTVNVSGAVRLE